MRQIDQKLLALVLKSKPLKEGDLLVTILTKQEGKLVLLAKGVRKINSKRRCFLESGNLIKAQIIPSHHLPILAQVELVSHTGNARESLSSLKKLLLFLEILDKLLVTDTLPAAVFRQILFLRELFLQNFSNRQIKKYFCPLLQNLGYTTGESQQSISAQVSELIGQPLCSFAYLSLKS